jgi:hypothetical protein
MPKGGLLQPWPQVYWLVTDYNEPGNRPPPFPATVVELHGHCPHWWRASGQWATTTRRWSLCLWYRWVAGRCAGHPKKLIVGPKLLHWRPIGMREKAASFSLASGTSPTTHSAMANHKPTTSESHAPALETSCVSLEVASASPDKDSASRQ